MNDNILDDILNIVKSKKLISCLRLCGFKNMFDFINFNEKSIDNIEKYVRLKCKSMSITDRSIYLDDFDVLSPHDFMISPGMRNRLLKAVKSIEIRAQIIQPSVSSIIRNCCQSPQISSISSFYKSEINNINSIKNTIYSDNYQNNLQSVTFSNLLPNKNIIKSDSNCLPSVNNNSNRGLLSDASIITIDLSKNCLKSLNGNDPSNEKVSESIISEKNITINEVNKQQIDLVNIDSCDLINNKDAETISAIRNDDTNNCSISFNINNIFDEKLNLDQDININDDKDVFQSNLPSSKNNVRVKTLVTSTTSSDVMNIMSKIISTDKQKEQNVPPDIIKVIDQTLSLANSTVNMNGSHKVVDEKNEVINNKDFYMINRIPSNTNMVTNNFKDEIPINVTSNKINEERSNPINTINSFTTNVFTESVDKVCSDKENSLPKDNKPPQSIFDNIKSTLARAQNQKSSLESNSKISSAIIINNIAIDMNSYYDDMTKNLNGTFANFKLVPKVDFELEFQIDNDDLMESYGYYICNFCNKRKIKFKFNEHMCILYGNVKQHVKRDYEENVGTFETVPEPAIESVVETVKRVLAPDCSHKYQTRNKIFRKD